ncbi:hypothetical protein BDR07DRAFT_87339 [Suillus spraguei]|nr:hypothetical protein BDR07DRAFT_87339 [Suillus spraguei]
MHLHIKKVMYSGTNAAFENYWRKLDKEEKKKYHDRVALVKTVYLSTGKSLRCRLARCRCCCNGATRRDTNIILDIFVVPPSSRWSFHVLLPQRRYQLSFLSLVLFACHCRLLILLFRFTNLSNASVRVATSTCIQGYPGCSIYVNSFRSHTGISRKWF